MSFEGAIKVDPSDVQPYMILSEIFISLKNYPDAINVLERAANAFPDNGYVFYMLSLANQNNGTPLPAVLAARPSNGGRNQPKEQEREQHSAPLPRPTFERSETH